MKLVIFARSSGVFDDELYHSNFKKGYLGAVLCSKEITEKQKNHLMRATLEIIALVDILSVAHISSIIDLCIRTY